MLADDQQVSYNYRVLQAKFGDGYGQTAPDGINNETREVTFRYDNLTITDFNTVMTFLRALKGATPFSVTLHGEASVTNYYLVPNSIATTVTAKHRTNSAIVHRSIQFSGTSCYDLGL